MGDWSWLVRLLPLFRKTRDTQRDSAAGAFRMAMQSVRTRFAPPGPGDEVVQEPPALALRSAIPEICLAVALFAPYITAGAERDSLQRAETDFLRYTEETFGDQMREPLQLFAARIEPRELLLPPADVVRAVDGRADRERDVIVGHIDRLLEHASH